MTQLYVKNALKMQKLSFLINFLRYLIKKTQFLKGKSAQKEEIVFCKLVFCILRFIVIFNNIYGD